MGRQGGVLRAAAGGYRERWSRVAEAVEDSSDALRMETVIQKAVEEAMPDGYDIARQIRTAMDRERRAPKP